MPRGFQLRDDILTIMYEAARDVFGPPASHDHFDRVRRGPYKLEVVLGRLWGTVGPDALDCIYALRVSVPNEAHMLCALHLLRGGTHVTVNFDIGIELAYDLICGRADLPDEAPYAYHDAILAWRALAPTSPAPILAVSSHDEFRAWLRNGQPSALLKVHGGLDRQQRALTDVVVVDIEELAQLTAERAGAVEALGAADRLLITGYSGGDPDVYRPLLAAAARTTTAWCCLNLPANSSIRTDARDHGIDLVQGSPHGLAVTALRKELGTPAPPVWPSLPLGGDSYTERFLQWRQHLLAAHPHELIAQSWAWLLADLGDLDAAAAMFASLPEAAPSTRLRYAEILYNRARGDDRIQAYGIFRELAAGTADAATRLHCLLRLGDFARGQATRKAGKLNVILSLAEAYLRPMQVLIATHNGRRLPEEAGDAYRALQQTTLRLLEQLASSAPRAFWPSIAVLCHFGSKLGGNAKRMVRNGNRLSLIRQHQAQLRALTALLRGRPAPQDVRLDMLALQRTYHAADDLAGTANCAVTLAVLACADGNRAAAQELIAEALNKYAADRPDGRPLPSGEAFVDVITRLINKFDRPDA